MWLRDNAHVWSGGACGFVPMVAVVRSAAAWWHAHVVFWCAHVKEEEDDKVKKAPFIREKEETTCMSWKDLSTAIAQQVSAGAPNAIAKEVRR